LIKTTGIIVIPGIESEPIRSEVQILNLDLHGNEIFNGFDQRFFLPPKK
jgi:hypothetical protein